MLTGSAIWFLTGQNITYEYLISGLQWGGVSRLQKCYPSVYNFFYRLKKIRICFKYFEAKQIVV